MLVLTRLHGQSIKIGNEVTVTVLGINGRQVKIGINAPKGVPVHREEVFLRIKAEKKP